MRVCARGAAKGVKIENWSADVLPFKGVDADKKPVKLHLDAGKSYTWCACGHSANQPWCDGTHSRHGLTSCRPVKFSVEKSGDYSLCNCKSTEHRPLCDGSHKQVSPVPRNVDKVRQAMFFEDSPVYDGVAKSLGYKVKKGGFQ